MSIILLIVLIVQNCASDNIVQMNVNGTSILGREYFTVFENTPYIAFYKIPFAEAPLGELRFKPPLPLPWFTKKFYNYSKTIDENHSSILTEDCLYLTLYMPNNGESDRAVIVWLHEHSNLDGPDFLIDENVIVVTISFRRSILGFLNTEDDFAQGNMGAKDIIVGLKWIRDNIIYFNGDPSRVTVMGSGEASDIVGSFLLSPLAEDLFSGVVAQSGSALSPAHYKSYNFEILNKLFCNFYGPFEKFNRTKIYQRLQNASLNKLISVSRDIFDSTEVRNDQRLIKNFGLTIELLKRGAFMDDLPLEMYKSERINSDVKVMMGNTSLESLYKLSGFINNKELLNYLNNNFQYLLPFQGNKDEYGSKRYKKIRRKIMDFYFLNGTIQERSLRRYAKYLSDQVIYPVLCQGRLHEQTSRNHVYLYRFSYKGSLNNVWESTLSNLNLTGATSGDEICYQFRCKYLEHAYRDIREDDKQFIKKIARLLANFAKYGNPTVEQDGILGKLRWEQLRSNENMKIMNFGKTFKMIDLPERRRMEFWDQLQGEYFQIDKREKVRDEL